MDLTGATNINKPVAIKPRYKVMIGAPSGGSVQYGAAKALFLASFNHDVTIWDSQASGGNFNTLWVAALNEGKAGRISHFGMLHGDLLMQDDPSKVRWVDILEEEREKFGVPMISAIAAIKDGRGVTSSGIGNPNNWWVPFRRFTVADLDKLPETFDSEMAGYPGKALLHNNGCFLCDMRDPAWYQTDEHGVAKVFFNFPEMVAADENGNFGYSRESEDWYFSRRVHEAGIRSCITKRLKTLHVGSVAFPNWGSWGSYQNGDEDTAFTWRADLPSRDLHHDQPPQSNKLSVRLGDLEKVA